MNIAEFSIKKNVITWVFTLLLVVVGIRAFNGLSRLEDPEFTIKEAVVVTPYPGASAEEVETEVSNVIEKAVQELGQLEYVQSRSTRGMSLIKAKIRDRYDKNSLPQVWDELRRKVNDNQHQLPPGAGPSIVNDDFGDVYGIFLAVTGEGYTYAELWDYVDLLQRELLLVQDVKKVVVYGKQPEVVYVEMSRGKMAQLGVSQDHIYAALSAKNLPASAGRLELGDFLIPISPTGEFKSEQEFGDLLISGGGSGRQVYLRDVATIRRGYADPPKQLLRYDGMPAIGIGISTIAGGNVVTMGEAMDRRLKELEPMAPVGMEINVISLQSEAVNTAIRGFVVSLLQAVAIVVVVLLFAMGLRSGLIIGAVLFITILGTFIFMDRWGVILERISLGALIIALGMLVDNAIVVTDGMKTRMEKGMDALSAAKEIVGQTAIPLLGATVVAVLAFAAIGTSPDSTGEYCRSLFQVILISLMLSWVTAVTITPLLCKHFLMPGKKPGGKDKAAKDESKGDSKESEKDAYAGGFYRKYRTGLVFAIKRRWVTLAIVAGIFLASMFAFGMVKQSFFPDSTRPQFFLDFYFAEGTRIDETASRLEAAEEYLRDLEGVTHVTTMVGGQQLRFLLTYAPEGEAACFGQILVDVEDFKQIAGLEHKVQGDLEALYPDAVVNFRKFLLGPGEGGKIQMRLYGPDRGVLRELAERARSIMLSDPGAKSVRDEWREKVMVVRPQIAESQARRAGIDRPEIARAIEAGFEGTRTGVYREGEELLAIVARAPESERINADALHSLQIWSPVAGAMIPLGQVVSGFKTEWEDANIWRRDRTTMLKLHCDAREELPSELFARIKPRIEEALGVDIAAATGKDPGPDPFEDHKATTVKVKYADKLPLKGLPGYYLAWGGEAEDSARAQGALSKSLPVFFAMMIVIVIFLFNSIRKPLVIWLTVPLALIGVTWGLLLTRQPFGFMALLGMLSLTGMLVKNAIVLVDEIEAQKGQGVDSYNAIVNSGVSRLRPVGLAAATTIMGMIPLLGDAFFVAMAVTIMAGLGFATLLTLVIVPVFYSIIFRVPSPKT
jgi:multidrug efflux pump subunit AcrB